MPLGYVRPVPSSMIDGARWRWRTVSPPTRPIASNRVVCRIRSPLIAEYARSWVGVPRRVGRATTRPAAAVPASRTRSEPRNRSGSCGRRPRARPVSTSTVSVLPATGTGARPHGHTENTSPAAISRPASAPAAGTRRSSRVRPVRSSDAVPTSSTTSMSASSPTRWARTGRTQAPASSATATRYRRGGGGRDRSGVPEPGRSSATGASGLLSTAIDNVLSTRRSTGRGWITAQRTTYRTGGVPPGAPLTAWGAVDGAPGRAAAEHSVDGGPGGVGDRPGEVDGRGPGLAGSDGPGLPTGPGSELPTLGAGIGAGTRMTGTWLASLGSTGPAPVNGPDGPVRIENIGTP